MYDNREVNWSEIISMTSSGLQIADYVTIRKAITKRFKEIYGEDIDVSTASADGVYLENYCLIINNILQGFKSVYANLDVNTASGRSLDVLAALSNIYRKAATHSTASLKVTLNENESTYTTSSISFLDGNGNTWTCNASDYQLQQLTFEPGVEKSITVICENLGPIVAEAGWIDRLASNDIVMNVVQENAASIGQNEETDSQLRARRNSTVGTNAVSVLEALAGSLNKIDGIEDVKIYNNTSNSVKQVKDGNMIGAHSVYVLLRYANNISIADSLLGTLIYEHMTPGIRTVTLNQAVPGEPAQTAHSFTYTASYLGNVISLDVPQIAYWTEVAKINTSFVITITPSTYFASNDNSTAKLIAEKVIDFANNLRIGEDLMVRDVDDEAILADPLFRGRRTYSVKSIKLAGKEALDLTDTLVESRDTCFNYTLYRITRNGNDIDITIS